MEYCTEYILVNINLPGGIGMWAHVHASRKYSISGRQIVRSEICSYSFLQHTQYYINQTA